MPCGREQAHLRRGELDRQRQPLEAPADVGDGGGVLVGERRSRAWPPARGRRTARTAGELRRAVERSRAAASVGRRQRLRPRRPARRGCAARCGWSRGSSPAARPCTAGRAPARHRRSARSCRARSARAGPSSARAMRSSSAGLAVVADAERSRRSSAAAARARARPRAATKYDAVGEEVLGCACATSIASRLLPIPPGPIRLTTRSLAAVEQLAHLARGRARGRSSSCRATGMRATRDARRLARRRRRPRARLVEALGEQGREVAGDLVLELVGGLEREVGGGVVGLDAGDELVEALVAVVAALDVDELRHRCAGRGCTRPRGPRPPRRARPSRSCRRRCRRRRRSARGRSGRARAAGAAARRARTSPAPGACRSIAARAARRSSASSRRVELTNTRIRWSGVRITRPC